MTTGQVDPHQIAGNSLGLISVTISWLGAWFNVVPVFLASLASLVAIIYYVLQVYKDPAFQAWQMKRAMRRLDKLRVRMKLLEIRAGLSPAIIEKTAVLREEYSRAQHEETDRKVHLLEEAKKEQAKPVT